MRIFLDTADVDEIRRAADAGLIDGVTTNPSLLAKVAGDRDPKEIFLEICETVDGPVSAEVVALDADTMVSEGKRLAELHDNIVVKVPLTEDGLRACRRLRGEGVEVNVTLCFSPTQAHLAAKAGATYISPFVGRIDDVSGDGMDLIAQIRQIYDNYGIETEILAASLRHPQHVVQSLLMGADCGTLPPKVLYQLLKHPLTDLGLERFLEDWRSLGADL
ncbi:MAG: fructose-6-phosphate aldolase [Gemmatimonadota bacterium]|nr:MAG: fructose-6-phosphate aldolase [Gemmatimonadota bacterium]